MARVLLAESDRRIGEFIAGILVDCGHAVELCGDGIEAATSLTTKGVDVVVTDLVLSFAKGDALRQNCAALGIPTITLSGREFHPEQAASGRPQELLEKPFRFADLQSVIEAVAIHSRHEASKAAFAAAGRSASG
jgi:DNA-binding response OmpR family regulator